MSPDAPSLEALRAELNRMLAHASQMQVDALTLVIDAGEQAIAIYRESVEELSFLARTTGEAGVTQTALRGRATIEALEKQLAGQRQARAIIQHALEQRSKT